MFQLRSSYQHFCFFVVVEKRKEWEKERDSEKSRERKKDSKKRAAHNFNTLARKQSKTRLFQYLVFFYFFRCFFSPLEPKWFYKVTHSQQRKRCHLI